MIYALTITIVVGLLVLAVLAGGALLARRVADGAGWPSIGQWRWYPSPLGLLILIPLVGLIVWRFFPLIFLLPIVLPLFRRGGRLSMPFFVRKMGNGPSPPDARREGGDEGAIEGESRPLDEE